MTPRVREILSWYGAENIGVLTNLARLLNQGHLRGTGKSMILSVDHGLNQGPSLSFSKNPDSYDTSYGIELAIQAGCNAYAAPLGALEACARDYAGEIPLILKVNTADHTKDSQNSLWLSSSMRSSVEQALQLGCCGVGMTIYPRSFGHKTQYEEVANLAYETRRAGLAFILWVGPMVEDSESSLDEIAYGAHFAAQLGAHIISLKIPRALNVQEQVRKIYSDKGIKFESMTDRTRHLLHSAFNGKRMVIFTGGAYRASADLLNEVSDLARGGAFGSVWGRNAFQRPKHEAIEILRQVMESYAGHPLAPRS